MLHARTLTRKLLSLEGFFDKEEEPSWRHQKGLREAAKRKLHLKKHKENYLSQQVNHTLHARSV